jgi:hypothetical protein
VAVWTKEGSTPAGSNSLRLSEAPGADCRGAAIKRRWAIPMIAPNYFFLVIFNSGIKTTTEITHNQFPGLVDIFRNIPFKRQLKLVKEQ